MFTVLIFSKPTRTGAPGRQPYRRIPDGNHFVLPGHSLVAGLQPSRPAARTHRFGCLTSPGPKATVKHILTKASAFH
jgi:hypothetical protein